jgi:response regulator NasT
MLDEHADPLRVLIAEDETIIRLDLRGLLEQNGFRVVAEAANGAQAVELARSPQPDVAILDLRLPELDGIEAARRIYAERPLPIVMLTAFSDRASVEGAIDAGVFAYVVKPFRETDVVPAVRAAAARHAELLAARRSAGQRPVGAVVVSLPSSSGHAWNVRLSRRDDGSVDVRGTH